MHVWGREWKRRELLDRVGSLSQLGGITPFEYSQGKAKGVGSIRVRTASGLEFSVLPEKGLDIFEASYQGRSMSWHSPVGVVHPAFYDARDVQWLKTFPGGLLSTCGLISAGSPSEDQGEQLGLHGAIGNTPAENVAWDESWAGDDCTLRISGAVREARVHGHNLLLRRSIETSLGARTIKVRDSVENQGFQPTPLMLLYHLNFGFPLLTDRSRFYAPSGKVEARNEHSRGTIQHWAEFGVPVQGLPERVYYHEMKPNAAGTVTVALLNDDGARDFGVAVNYGAASLPSFVQWKMTSVNHFVLGLEPANCRVEGRKSERERGTLVSLEPGEKQDFFVEISVLDGLEEVSKVLQTIA
jgi:hypothetical protein